MRLHLKRVGAFCLATGLVTLTSLGSVTSADARRVTRHANAEQAAHRSGVEAGRVQKSERRRARTASRRHARAARAASAPRPVFSREDAVERRGRATRRQTPAPAAATAWGASEEPGYDQRYPADWHASASPADRRAASSGMATGGLVGGLVEEARRWIGTNPTNRRTLWCGAFMNFVLQRNGQTGTGSDLAKSFASIGRRVSGPQVGAIAVMSRRGGGHVGVVSGVDAKGDPVIISGNSRGRRVAENVYPRGRIYAYVMP